MSTDPFEVLYRPSSPHRPDPRFGAVLLRRVEEELGMTTFDIDEELQARPAIGLGIVHVKVPDADRAFAFYSALLGWQSEPFREGFTADYVTNTSLLTVLTDNPAAAPVRMWFPFDDLRAAIETVERLGGRVTSSEVSADGGGWLEADDGQGVALGIWRPGNRYRESDEPVEVPRGELGYFTFKVPDTERGVVFYSELLGWRFDDACPTGYRHVPGSEPSVGMYPGGDDRGEVALYVRVHDIADVVTRARALGADVSEPAASPSGLSARCTDDQGLLVFLWQPAPGY